ncbi:MAG: rhomboid family intramembrane serine protease [Pseudomonadota bacterium]
MPQFRGLDPEGESIIAQKDPTEAWVQALRLVLVLLVLLWVVQAVNTGLGMRLNLLGIYPREVTSLGGILVWPLLHADFEHLIMNTAPLAILGFFVALRGVRVFLLASLLILVLAGLGVWLFGRPAFHIGASGLVFGYFGFLVAIGIYEKSIPSLAIASFAVFYYGGLIYGVLPQDSFVSFEAHLFGLCAGVLAARVFALRRRRF